MGGALIQPLASHSCQSCPNGLGLESLEEVGSGEVVQGHRGVRCGPKRA